MRANPVSKAIQYFSKLHQKIDNELGRRLRARARELPSMIENIGLIPTLSFCYGKAEAETYKSIYNSYCSEEKIDVEKEKGGYGLYLLLALLYLRDLGLINDDMLKNPIDAFGKLCEESSIASRLLMPYLLEIKRLAEAVYPE